jgi:bifunctional DNA-binding transcriptional regulator/antitoxin component of YhaV-PrlF toxin-antitoxin module
MAKRPVSESKVYTFIAPLESLPNGMDTACIAFPYDVQQIFGTKGQVKVKATFDGHPYRGVLAPMGMPQHIIGVTKEIRKAIGKKTGDRVSVTITADTEERIVEMPDDLVKLLKKDKALNAFFLSLSYTNRKEYARWISSAAKEETRTRRLALTEDKLKNGKKNPSEK